MEVILKPTSKCNFNCTFCSAANLELMHLVDVPTQLKEQLQLLQPDDIIVTGGEPLCVSPSFYDKLLQLSNWNLSMTSNLKDFHLNQNKWIQLFKNKRVSICTSFQYGENRKWDNDTIYDENMFKDVMQHFHNVIGYMPQFIAVIDETNEEYAFKHLELAKVLNTKCKLNSMMPLGRSTRFYPMHKIVKLLLDAIDAGYEQQLNMDICFKNGGCNFNTSMMCQNTIRAIAFDKNGNMLYSNCEDDIINNEFIKKDLVPLTQKKSMIDRTNLISDKCMLCELFYLCNGCKQNRKINKLTKNHCQQMLRLKSRILSHSWKLQP